MGNEFEFTQEQLMNLPEFFIHGLDDGVISDDTSH